MFIVARKCGQQHNSCRDLPEDDRDFDSEFYWTAQAVGFQTAEQFSIPDPLFVRFTASHHHVIRLLSVSMISFDSKSV